MASADEIGLVIERLRIMPRDMRLNIGQYGSFNADQLIKQVEEGTELGQMVVDMQMKYLRSFKERVK